MITFLFYATLGLFAFFVWLTGTYMYARRYGLSFVSSLCGVGAVVGFISVCAL